MKNKHIYTIITIILLIITIFIIFIVLSTHSSKPNIEKYFGISEDNKWITYFNVYEENNEKILKGDVICLDKHILSQFDVEKIKSSNLITITDSKGNGFGGNYIYDDVSKFTIINFVNDDKTNYINMAIKIVNYSTELDLIKYNK